MKTPSGRALWAARAGLAGLLTLAPGAVHADEPKGLELEWNAPDGCPDRAEAEAAVREFTGQESRTDASPDFVKVDIQQVRDDRWEARIVTHGPLGTGVRRFEGASCKRVAEATILIVAMTLDPTGVAEQLAGMRSTPPRPQTPTPAAADRAAGLIGVRAVADVGSLPGPTLGVAGLFGIQSGIARFEAEATLWQPRLALTGPSQGTGGEIALYTGGFRGCFDFLQGSGGELRLGACVGGEAGVSTGRGIGLNNPARSSGLWAAGLAGLSVRQIGSSGLTFWASADVGAPIRRPIYVIDNFPVFEASPVVGRASCGMAWVFQ